MVVVVHGWSFVGQNGSRIGDRSGWSLVVSGRRVWIVLGSCRSTIGVVLGDRCRWPLLMVVGRWSFSLIVAVGRS